jgi:two-component system, cell cycle sensor histidine kinase and response regulator CckA
MPLRNPRHRLRRSAFARQQPLRPQRVDINELVSGITRLLSRTLGEQVEISLDLSSDVWPIIVDPAQRRATR